MEKREFLKIMGATAISVAVAPYLVAQEKDVEIAKYAEGKPKEEAMKVWKTEPEDKHTPVVKVTREGEVAVVSINVTKHPQSESHFIDRVELWSDKLIFASDIMPVLGVSDVVCRLKLPADTKLTAVSHCNKHGYYQSPVTL